MLTYGESAYLAAVNELEATNKDPFELDDIFDYAASVVMDIGVTTANSLTWVATLGQGGTDFDTGEAMHALNEDAGNFYDQNKDLVQLSSFIGGVFIPGFAAAKTLSWARGGRTWIGKTETAIRTNEDKAISELKKFGKRTEEFNEARSSMRIATMKSGAAEGIIYELEFAALMNDHSYMDNDYDLADFALGAAIGGLVIPLRLIQQERKFKALGREAVIPQVSPKAFTPTMQLQGATPGATLSIQGMMYTNWKLDDLSGSSKEIIEMHNIAERQHINGISNQILDMTTDKELKGRIGFTIDKGAAPVPRSLEAKDPYTNTPDEYLGRLAVADPAALVGVKTLANFNAERPLHSTIGGIMQTADSGALSFIDGIGARNILFPASRAATAKSLKELTAAAAPLGVKLSDDTIEITTKEVTDAQNTWISEYLSHPTIAKAPIEITGGVGKLSQAALDREATWKVFDSMGTHEEFIPHTDVLERLDFPSSRAAIADPYFGDRLISEVDALVGAGVNAYPTLSVAKGVTMRTELGTAPFKQSVAMTDKAYQEAIIAAKNLPANTKSVEVNLADAIPKVQAIINRFSDDLFPSISIGDITLTTKQEAVAYLWKEKQALVVTGKNAGASPIQIARAANIHIETAETLLATRGKLVPVTEKLPISRYTDKDYKVYYDQKPIQLEGNIAAYGKVEEIAVTAMHDKTDLIAIDRAITTNIIESSGVPLLANFMKTVLFTPISKAIGEQLPKALASFGTKWNVALSADHAYRELGDMGAWITTYGADLANAVTKQTDSIKKAISGSMAAVAANPVARTQFSQLRQAIHAIGREDAVHLRYDAPTGKIITGMVDDTPTYLTHYGSDKEMVLGEQMQGFMSSWLPAQQELLGIHNTSRQLRGLPKSKGAGIWFPYPELEKKLVAYKVANSDQPFSVELIIARDAKSLEESVAKARELHGATHSIITKADSADWNQINRYAELEDFKVADVSLTKTGITYDQISPGFTDIDNFMASIDRTVWSNYRNIARSSNSHLHDSLDFFAQRESKATGDGKGLLQHKKTSLPELVSKTMLNSSLVQNTPILDTANNWTTVVINTIADKTHTAAGAILDKGSAKEYEELSEALTKAGVPNPWKDLEAYISALRNAKVSDIALKRVQKAQSVMVLLNLRLLEASHAAVTVMSLPVILQGELAHITGKGGVSPLKHMMEAAKFWGGNSVEARKLKALAEDKRHVKAIVSEISNAMEDFHTSQTFFGKHREVLDLLSSPSDLAEGWVREQAYSSGYLLAKKKNPNAPMELLAAEAYAFTQRTMGNYVTRQRPTMFQGTFGAMIGLYQTFMLTMGQNMFRYMEAGDAKAMRNLWGAQGSMFGIESLPMFQQFNQLLGGYVSDDHEDIRSTVYSVFGEDTDQSRSAAEYLLFGAPSTLFGAGVYTRGAIDPRSPMSITGDAGFAFKPAVLDAGMQAVEFAVNLASSVGKEDTSRSILQGFAAQSLWRPAARVSEVFMGDSFDRKGALISTTEEVMEPFALFSRAIGARPLREQALRNLRFSNTYYNSIDTDRRAKYTKELRRIVTDEPDPKRIDELFLDFIDSPGGTIRGWKQISNAAYAASETPYANRLVDAVKRQPVIQSIVDTYAQ